MKNYWDEWDPSIERAKSRVAEEDEIRRKARAYDALMLFFELHKLHGLAML